MQIFICERAKNLLFYDFFKTKLKLSSENGKSQLFLFRNLKEDLCENKNGLMMKI